MKASGSSRNGRCPLRSKATNYLGPQTRAGLIFGYGTVDLPEMTQGLSSLRKALLS